MSCYASAIYIPSKSSVYPLVRNSKAFAYLSGVFNRPSRSTSSPILSSNIRTASEIFSILRDSADMSPISRLSNMERYHCIKYRKPHSILTRPIQIIGNFNFNFTRNYFITNLINIHIFSIDSFEFIHKFIFGN